MAEKMVKYHQFVKEKAGKEGMMRLAMKTCVASIIANDMPDSPEHIQRFQQAVKEITGQDVNFK